MDNKIFITLGSQKFQFNRLLKAVEHMEALEPLLELSRGERRL